MYSILEEKADMCVRAASSKYNADMRPAERERRKRGREEEMDENWQVINEIGEREDNWRNKAAQLIEERGKKASLF